MMSQLGTARREVSEWFDTVNGFYVAMMLISFFRGVSYLSGFLAASIAEQTLPTPLRIWLIGELGISAGVALSGYLWKHFTMEKVGLTFLAPAALAYGLLILSQAPKTGSLSFVIYTLTAAASVIRYRQIRRAHHVTAQLMKRLDQ